MNSPSDANWYRGDTPQSSELDLTLIFNAIRFDGLNVLNAGEIIKPAIRHSSATNS